MKLSGKVWKLWDNVDTDLIIAGQYLNIFDAHELSKHCLESIRPDFTSGVQKGDILLAGRNFGCGSAREHAPLALKAAGVSCIIASSFSRIFFRNSLNIGLPIFECPEAFDNINEGANIEIDTLSGEIKDSSTGAIYQAKPFPPFIEELIRCGGLIPYLKRRKK
jgi:3-isopropylmalate/(R)-2-methylmalate dehydratase small subunit